MIDINKWEIRDVFKLLKKLDLMYIGLYIFKSIEI